LERVSHPRICSCGASICQPTPRLSHPRPFEPSIKSQFFKILITFGDKCPRNGSRNVQTAPRTSMGYPHEGPSVAPPSARERDFFIDNLLDRIHPIMSQIFLVDRPRAMEFEFPFPGSLISTFLGHLPTHTTVELQSLATRGYSSEHDECRL